ncbi:hypothetical protein Tco_0653908 [Tanacetum coccineum]|uniref:Uncharacterized protein n=1 Tax=Tanacetum coccineum TaxID=301880 RepID=A0ABQ4X1V8_9ASTR
MDVVAFVGGMSEGKGSGCLTFINECEQKLKLLGGVEEGKAEWVVDEKVAGAEGGSGKWVDLMGRWEGRKGKIWKLGNRRLEGGVGSVDCGGLGIGWKIVGRGEGGGRGVDTGFGMSGILVGWNWWGKVMEMTGGVEGGRGEWG